MTTPTNGINGYGGHFRDLDIPTVGARVYHPTTPQEVRRRILLDLCIYDTLIWGDLMIMRLPFHRYRVTNAATGRSERVGGRTATGAAGALLRRLGLAEGMTS